MMKSEDHVKKLENVMYLACKLALDICDNCDLNPKTCLPQWEYCPNRDLREAIKAVHDDGVKEG